jgi:hypothetical protein
MRHWLLNHHRCCQLDRTSDILVGKAKKKALKKVRNAHLPSGKVSPSPHELATKSWNPWTRCHGHRSRTLVPQQLD